MGVFAPMTSLCVCVRVFDEFGIIRSAFAVFALFWFAPYEFHGVIKAQIPPNPINDVLIC